MQYKPIHEIGRDFGKVNSRVFFFHALRGCDTIRAVAGNGKLSFYQTCFIKSYCKLWKE